MRRPDHKSVLRLIGAAVIAAMYLPAAVRTSPRPCRILIPADRPVAVIEPMRVDVLNDAGDRGIRIPPGAGRGWCKEAGGSAGYVCYLPADGTYVLWAYCLWGEACTNAVYLQVDDSAKAVLGNDPVYGRWHWVRGAPWPLKRGTHTLTLSNHSDGIAVARLMLLNDPFEHPDRAGPAHYDLFHDGFDGCDGGNIADWTLPPAGWRLAEPDPRDFSRRVLCGESRPGELPVVASVGADAWRAYAVNCRVRMNAPGPAAIAFAYRDPADCICLQWRVDVARARTRFTLQRRTAGGTRGAVQQSRPAAQWLGEIDAPFLLHRWHEVEADARAGRFRLRVDGRDVGELPFAGTLDGRIGLWVADGGCMWIDDVHVRATERSNAQACSPASGKEVGCAAQNCP